MVRSRYVVFNEEPLLQRGEIKIPLPIYRCQEKDNKESAEYDKEEELSGVDANDESYEENTCLSERGEELQVTSENESCENETKLPESSNTGNSLRNRTGISAP